MKPDISNFFRKKNANFKPPIDLEEEPIFLSLVNDLKTLPEFVTYYNDNSTYQEVFLDSHAESFIKDIIISYYYRFGLDFEKEKLAQIYCRLTKLRTA